MCLYGLLTFVIFKWPKEYNLCQPKPFPNNNVHIVIFYENKFCTARESELFEKIISMFRVFRCIMLHKKVYAHLWSLNNCKILYCYQVFQTQISHTWFFSIYHLLPQKNFKKDGFYLHFHPPLPVSLYKGH